MAALTVLLKDGEHVTREGHHSGRRCGRLCGHRPVRRADDRCPHQDREARYQFPRRVMSALLATLYPDIAEIGGFRLKTSSASLRKSHQGNLIRTI